MNSSLLAGAAEIDITPKTSQFLLGYPHVERYSEGVDTPLYSSSLFISDGHNVVMFIGNDLVYLSRQQVAEIRLRIAEKSGIPPENIMVTCTHTHSGPVTTDRIARQAEVVVPLPDEEYISWCIGKIVEGAVRAYLNAEPVKIGFGIADSTGVGTNRRNPGGPANPKVPVITITGNADDSLKAIMLVCSMHPTVLHEDSRLISADFPGYCRKFLKDNIAPCPVVYHTGPAGDQSPRHVTRENTPAEARRLGEILGQSVQKTINDIVYDVKIELACKSGHVEFPLNEFPDENEALVMERQTWEKFQKLKQKFPDSKETRTAECAWFGAEKCLQFSRLYKTGELAIEAAKRMPAEVQIIKVGKFTFVGWSSEIFVEYGLKVMKSFNNTFVIAYANGETQSYLVTEKALREGGYESKNAVFKSPQSGNLLVEKSLELLNMVK